MRCDVPNRRCGWRNQCGRMPSSETRLRTPLDPTIDVLTAAGARVMRTDLNGDVAVAGGPSLQVVVRGGAVTTASGQDFRRELTR